MMRNNTADGVSGLLGIVAGVIIIIVVFVITFYGVMAADFDQRGKGMTSGELVIMPSEWDTSYAAAKQEHESTGRPLVMYFGARDCGYCKRMERYVWTDSNVKSKLKNHVLCHQTRERHAEVFRRFKVTGVPVMLLVKDGRIVRRRVGYMSAADAKRFLE